MSFLKDLLFAQLFVTPHPLGEAITGREKSILATRLGQRLVRAGYSRQEAGLIAGEELVHATAVKGKVVIGFDKNVLGLPVGGYCQHHTQGPVEQFTTLLSPFKFRGGDKSGHSRMGSQSDLDGLKDTALCLTSHQVDVAVEKIFPGRSGASFRQIMGIKCADDE